MAGNLIAKKIMKECNKRKISIYQLAQKSEIRQSTMNAIINGQNPNPTFRTIERVCSGLEVSIKDFFDDTIFK